MLRIRVLLRRHLQLRPVEDDGLREAHPPAPAAHPLLPLQLRILLLAPESAVAALAHVVVRGPLLPAVVRPEVARLQGDHLVEIHVVVVPHPPKHRGRGLLVFADGVREHRVPRDGDGQAAASLVVLPGARACCVASPHLRPRLPLPARQLQLVGGAAAGPGRGWRGEGRRRMQQGHREEDGGAAGKPQEAAWARARPGRSSRRRSWTRGCRWSCRCGWRAGPRRSRSSGATAQARPSTTWMPACPSGSTSRSGRVGSFGARLSLRTSCRAALERPVAKSSRATWSRL
mmetsp:Transcript_9479/g.26649  ORF Transcript_9479/g.26649 Transcript_9479/m.26649 type:complete len:288 (-) Transcript_9479:213-1076(-)